MHPAGTIAAILVPVGLIAVMLAIWYWPFRHASPRDHGVEAGNTSIEQHPVSQASPESDIITRPEMVARPASSPRPSYTSRRSDLDAHQSSRLSRISEEDHHYHHHHHHHHHLFGFHK